MMDDIKTAGKGWSTEHEVAWLRSLKNETLLRYYRSLPLRRRWSRLDGLEVRHATERELYRRGLAPHVRRA